LEGIRGLPIISYENIGVGEPNSCPRDLGYGQTRQAAAQEGKRRDADLCL
jgi:hypothetical protein